MKQLVSTEPRTSCARIDQMFIFAGLDIPKMMDNWVKKVSGSPVTCIFTYLGVGAICV